MSLPVDGDVHELRLGQSFEPHSRVAFHSFRYDFKPASVDTSKEAKVEVGEGHQVTVTVPHVAGAGTSHTVFKGNKKPTAKECVLIIDHETGTYTLEKLDQSVLVKKTRFEGSGKNHRPTTPVDAKKSSPSKGKNSKSSPSSMRDSPSITPLHSDADKDDIARIHDLSSDSDASEDEDMVEVPDGTSNGVYQNGFGQPTPTYTSVDSMLKDDLELSESGSDSD
ncbi:ELL-associated factor 1-like isoform X2 [Pomacea canaliculata]|uniref:ELL-associated factor 1-like isoform X2 n=1 Tax=Pomacea canaliculata TaxID=400727 RepID=UPI000D736A80|nr:ELL-associated factor 1-like isoform X2 [Pomacea canaliculata]